MLLARGMIRINFLLITLIRLQFGNCMKLQRGSKYLEISVNEAQLTTRIQLSAIETHQRIETISVMAIRVYYY